MLVTDNLRGKIADFGSIRSVLMKQKAHKGKHADGATELIATAATGVGTPLYMAPEVLNGSRNTPAADVWSYGVLLWELVTERQPDLLEQEGVSASGPQLSKLTDLLLRGARLNMDCEGWTDWARNVVRDCFKADPALRPSFNQIMLTLTTYAKLLEFQTVFTDKSVVTSFSRA